MRRPLAIAISAALAVGVACGADGPGADSASDRILDGPHETALFRVSHLGTIRVELLPELAPETVAHFKKLAGKRFYDGTSFHRVIPGYLIMESRVTRAASSVSSRPSLASGRWGSTR